MSINKPKCVVFDFDYTLADSSIPVIECVNYGLKVLGLPEARDELIRSTIGMDLITTLCTLAGKEHIDKGKQFIKLFTSRADQVMVDGTGIFKFVPDVLRTIVDRDISVAIVSSKFRFRIESILVREGILDYFDFIIGGEDVENLKPDPEGLIKVLSNLGVFSAEAIYVGDSLIDAKTAKEANVPFVAVLSGVTSSDSFISEGCEIIVKDITALPTMLFS